MIATFLYTHVCLSCKDNSFNIPSLYICRVRVHICRVRYNPISNQPIGELDQVSADKTTSDNNSPSRPENKRKGGDVSLVVTMPLRSGRASKACDLCRRHKTRCYTSQTRRSCLRCTTLRQNCSLSNETVEPIAWENADNSSVSSQPQTSVDDRYAIRHTGDNH
jgi:hypothetical protein